jgi:hypothetical protein
MRGPDLPEGRAREPSGCESQDPPGGQGSRFAWQGHEQRERSGGENFSSPPRCVLPLLIGFGRVPPTSHAAVSCRRLVFRRAFGCHAMRAVEDRQR